MKLFENLKIKSFKIVILLIIFSAKVFANTETSAQAEKLYEQKKYAEAIVIYEGIIAEHQISDKLYYNLGNCYFKTNQIGKAIYNYELAHKLNPADADIKVNLKIASSKTIDKIENKENYFIGALKTGIVNMISSNGWAWLSIISLIVSFGMLFLFFIAKTGFLKRIGFFIGALSLIIFVISMVLGYSSINMKHQTSFAIILKREVKVQTEPNTTSESKFSLHEGTKTAVINQTAKWVNIRLENGNEGWIEASNVGLF